MLDGVKKLLLISQISSPLVLSLDAKVVWFEVF